MREDLSCGKVGIITDVMRLNAEEAGVFWPIYQEYEKELFELGDQRVDAIRRFVAAQSSGGLDAATATKLSEAYFDFEAKRGPVEIEHLDAHNQPRRMKLRGRVDRIDRATTLGGIVWRVVDYKSGEPPQPRHFRRGVALQTPLYMKALAVKECVTVDVGRYRSLKNMKNRERTIDWGQDEFEKALRTAVSIPERVRRGLFELALANGETWAPWDPGIEIRRGSATLAVESRFDE
jgi:hypothetical protein